MVDLTERHRQAIEALNLWQEFWDDMPKGQLGKIVCDVGLLNDAFLATTAVLKGEKRGTKKSR